MDREAVTRQPQQAKHANTRSHVTKCINVLFFPNPYEGDASTASDCVYDFCFTLRPEFKLLRIEIESRWSLKRGLSRTALLPKYQPIALPASVSSQTCRFLATPNFKQDRFPAVLSTTDLTRHRS